MKILAIVLMITTVAMGQRHDRAGKQITSEERAQKRAETLKAKLKLTDAQYQQVYSQLLSNDKKIQAQRDEMKRMQEENDAKMKSILTPEQYEQFKQMQAQRRENMKGKREHPDHPSDDSPKDEK